MYDVSGEGWVKHILYGTSKILQVRGPEAHLTGPGRSFFLTVRIFEICRSLIYTEPSFLFIDDWVSLMGRMWEGDFATEWHPKEALFDIMTSGASLSCRYVLSKYSPFPTSNLPLAYLQLSSQDTNSHLKPQ